jgi:hypothetical protein
MAIACVAPHGSSAAWARGAMHALLLTAVLFVVVRRSVRGGAPLCAVRYVCRSPRVFLYSNFAFSSYELCMLCFTHVMCVCIVVCSVHHMYMFWVLPRAVAAPPCPAACAGG